MHLDFNKAFDLGPCESFIEQMKKYRLQVSHLASMWLPIMWIMVSYDRSWNISISINHQSFLSAHVKIKADVMLSKGEDAGNPKDSANKLEVRVRIQNNLIGWCTDWPLLNAITNTRIWKLTGTKPSLYTEQLSGYRRQRGRQVAAWWVRRTVSLSAGGNVKWIYRPQKEEKVNHTPTCLCRIVQTTQSFSSRKDCFFNFTDSKRIFSKIGEGRSLVKSPNIWLEKRLKFKESVARQGGCS